MVEVAYQEPAFEESEMYEEYIPEPEPEPEVINIPMNISEAEHTIQDGGILVGMPALTLKLLGCNLNCIWCDVKKKKVDRAYNMSSIIPLLVGYADLDLVITGGEPLIQPNALGYILNIALDARQELGYSSNVVVETNGTISPDILKRSQHETCRLTNEKMNSIVWSVNPKLHSSGEEWSKTKFVDFIDFRNIQIKLTVNPFDADDVTDMRRIVSLIPNGIHIVAQPVVRDLEDYDHEGYQKSLSELFKIITDERFARVRLIPQIHKVIWGMQKESL